MQRCIDTDRKGPEHTMRLRNIPAAADAVAAHPSVIHDPLSRSAPCLTASPLHVELGMGKGQFLLSMAASYPDIQFIGMERYDSVLYRALQRLDAEGDEAPGNIAFICGDAAQADLMFLPRSVDVIYLNFSDPWPKKRHANRRLTARPFLERYRRILSAPGRIEMKTDNMGLFHFTLEELTACGWEILISTENLHADPLLSAGNHLTEYEAKFSEEGHPICKVIARPPR